MENLVQIKNTYIEGLLLIQPNVFTDSRGQFFESFNSKKFNKSVGCEVMFVQDNQSISRKGVLRGMHMQVGEFAQDKLVNVNKGAVFDVAVDLRKGSKTFGKSYGTVLSAENKMQMWIPKGFAHGFLTLTEEAIFHYKVSNYYSPSNELSLHWNSEDLHIEWPKVDEIICSDKDNNAERSISKLKLD